MGQFVHVNSPSGGSYALELPSAEDTASSFGLVATRAVETIDGWCGQVLVDSEIVYQGEGQPTKQDAKAEANKCVVNAVKSLFTFSNYAKKDTAND